MFRLLFASLRPPYPRPFHSNVACPQERRALSARWYLAWLAAFIGLPQLVRSAQADCRDNQLPIAAAGPDLTGEPGVPLTFEAFTSDDPDGEVIAYNWSFNDGTSLTLQTSSTAVHTFANAGEYRVRLWVMDDCGELSLADEAMVTIAENTNPCANSAAPVAVAGPDREVEPNETIEFDASASYDPDGRIELYGWDFGDGRRSAGKHLTHAYAEPGTYIVTLTVLDDCFVWSETPDEVVVTVGNPDPCADNSAPIAVASGPDSAETGQTLNFSGSGSSDPDDNIFAHEWDFGDGNTDTGASVSHSYAEPGTYTVTLTVSDSCDISDSDSITVEVAGPCDGNSAPNAVASGPDSAETNQTLNFSGSGSSDPDDNLVTYEWDFGDGNTDTGASVSHSYDEPGTYVATLTVTDECDLTDSDSLTLEISEPDPCEGNHAPVAEATGPGSAETGQTLNFNGSGSSDPDDNIATYEWDFADGATASGAQASHSYDTAGTYAVTLTVTDECGATDADTLNVVVSDPGSGELTANFTFSPQAPWVDDPVTFIADAPASDDYLFYWVLSDGVSTFARSFSHAFEDGGDYEVTLMLYFYDTGETLETTQTVSVYEDPPMQLLDLLEGDLGPNSGIAIAGNGAWVIDDSRNLVTVDVSDPTNISALHQQTLNSWPWDIAASEDIVAVGALSDGVYLFDATHPEGQTLLGRYNTYDDDDFMVFGVALAGDLLYAAGHYYGGLGELRVVDISTPQNPLLLATSASVGSPTCVVVSGDRAFIGDISAPAVHALNLDPNHDTYAYLEVVSTASLSRRPLDIAVDGPVLAVVERVDPTVLSPGSLAFFDISQPDQIQFRSRLGNSSSPYRSVALCGEYAYVTYGHSLLAFCITDLDNPVQHHSLPLLGHLGGVVRIHGPHVYTGLTASVLATVAP